MRSRLGAEMLLERFASQCGEIYALDRCTDARRGQRRGEQQALDSG